MFRLWVTVWLCTLLAWTELGSAQSLDHAIVKRSDDTNPLEAVVSKLTQDMTQVQARVTALENARGKRAAFLAQSAKADVTANTPIPFNLLFNIGNGYDTTLNMFIAPYSGVYIFTVQVFNGLGDLLVDLMQNNNIIARIRVYDATYSTSEASSLTQHCTSGDRFWVRVNHETSTIYTGVHTFFSGALLSPDV